MQQSMFPLCAVRTSVILYACSLVAVTSAIGDPAAAGASFLGATVSTTMSPQFADRLAKFTEDSAWRIGGMATSDRSATSHLRAEGASNKAAVAARAAIPVSEGTAPLIVQANTVEAAANASLQAALATETRAMNLSFGLSERAYMVAKQAAEERVATLDAEAKTYFQKLVQELLAVPPPVFGPAQAAALAAKPYVDVQLRVSALVQSYNDRALLVISQANELVGMAFGLANRAQLLQASGDWEMAQRTMIQAHGCIVASNLKKEEAKKLRILVENLNSSIPSYQKAAQMAAIHAFATFAGVQLSSKDQEMEESEQKAAEASSQQVSEKFAALSSDLARLTRTVAEIDERAARPSS